VSQPIPEPGTKKAARRPRAASCTGMPVPAPAPLGLGDLVDGFRRLGLRAGQSALVHYALRTLGPVDSGAATVVDALLAVLGPTGTLVVPAFTFIHEVEAAPIIDPAADPSEMGAITEAARTRPNAVRSTAFRHSFAAIGRRAAVIAGVDPALAPYDLRSAFGVMLALDTQVVLLGVTYSNSTSHHFGEWYCEVPYRHVVRREVRLRRPDGTVVPQAMDDYQPKPSPDGSYYGSRSTDFNFLGRMLEERGEATVGAVGNAIVRRFAMRALIAMSEVEAARDVNVFRTAEGDKEHVTQLRDGVFVFSDPTLDGAGRPEHRLWSVVDPERIVGWKTAWRVVRPEEH
jgi:aminoglycoside 3-N-acetyltransferase